MDAKEIQDEEECFVQELDRDCDDFSVIAAADVEAAWIKLLSRRAVMMEEALFRAKVKRENKKASVRRGKVDELKVCIPVDNLPQAISENLWKVSGEIITVSLPTSSFRSCS